MASEQGAAGGGLESNRRQVRKSETEIAENDTKAQIPTTTESADKGNYDHRIGQLPRRYSTPSANTATPGPLSRNPSNCSTMSAQATAESGVHLSASGSSSGSSQRRQQQQQEQHQQQQQPQQPQQQPAEAEQPRPLEPPVTKATLSELDVNKILMNPKLRHDINFDPELHFRPNMDGEKGKQKHEKANQFWNSLLQQLMLFVTDWPAFITQHGRDDWCLPSLLRAVKEIIQTLVPVRDRAIIDEGLDVDLLMQQFEKGTADLEKLASWLSGVLKSHCAPMRDEWVDEMYTQISNGNSNNDLPELVKGMRSLLNVLEAMKLDVANHQIRCLRPMLIEDTVHFEQKYHAKRMCHPKIKLDATDAMAWYTDATRRFSGSHRSRKAFGEMAIFFEALGRLLMPSADASQISKLQIFQFDEDRISKLRSDLLDSICLEICMRMYEELEARCRRQQQQQPGSWTREMDIDSDSVSSSDSDSAHSAHSSHSSPRSSAIFTTPVTPADVDPAKSRQLYESLVALVQTAPSSSRRTSRWRSLAPNMALQILRTTTASLHLLPEFEAELMKHLSGPPTALRVEVEKQFHGRLMTELASRVGSLKGLTGLNLFHVATAGRTQSHGKSLGPSPDLSGLEALMSPSSSRDPRERAGLDDLATRTAHLGILHWRVWSTILYNHIPDVAASPASSR